MHAWAVLAVSTLALALGGSTAHAATTTVDPAGTVRERRAIERAVLRQTHRRTAPRPLRPARLYWRTPPRRPLGHMRWTMPWRLRMITFGLLGIGGVAGVRRIRGPRR